MATWNQYFASLKLPAGELEKTHRVGKRYIKKRNGRINGRKL